MEWYAAVILKEPKRLSGGVTMATSSIFDNVKITDPKEVERFVAALEESEKAQINKPVAKSYPVLKDLDEIRRLMAKRKSAK